VLNMYICLHKNLLVMSQLYIYIYIYIYILAINVLLAFGLTTQKGRCKGRN
jgi:hypothetical protein